MIKVGNYCHPKLIFLLDKLLVIIVLPSTEGAIKMFVVCKNILLQLFCLKSLFEWKYVVPLQPINKNSSASDLDKKFRDMSCVKTEVFAR